MANIMCIGAHPDDIELGSAGTILKHLQNGDEVYALILTNGEMGNHPIDRRECLDSLKKIGIKNENIVFGNFPDGFVEANLKTIKFIEDNLKKYKIQRVYTHSPDDRHQDHRNLSLSVTSAARKIPEIFHFQGPSTHLSFVPHYFIELSKEEVDKKIESLSCYKTQVEKGIIDIEFAKNIAIVNGKAVNAGFAEAFFINHLLRSGKDV